MNEDDECKLGRDAWEYRPVDGSLYYAIKVRADLSVRNARVMCVQKAWTRAITLLE